MDLSERCKLRCNELLTGQNCSANINTPYWVYFYLLHIIASDKKKCTYL